MTSFDIKSVERNIENSKAQIDLAKSLDKLFNNRDFKKVIVDGYLRDNAIRLVHLKAEESMQSEEHQRKLDKQIEAIGQLNNYFTTIYQLAQIAESSLQADEQTLEELLSEGV